MSNRKLWRHTVGKKGHKVTVFERRPGGSLYAQCWDPSLCNGRGNMRKVSLGHRDKDQAIAFAHRQAAQLRQGRSDLRAGRVTLAHLFALYERHRTPRKSLGEQATDRRRMKLWARFLGPDKNPHKITLREWETFIDARRIGAIDALGKETSLAERKPVGPRTVEADCKWLKWVVNWGTRWRDREGSYVLHESPLRGFETPIEKNPKRPVATEDRFEAVRAVADDVTMRVIRGGKRTAESSCLAELLDIVNGTGRRISAVCQLRCEDLRLERKPECPFGAIRWRADSDKTGCESTVPMGPSVRAAIDRILNERPGIARAPLFPSPSDPTKPVSRHLADRWLRRAEELAGLKPQEGSLWHAYRRKWVTERKHLPDVDVAAAGGWKTTTTLKRAYQQTDQQTMLNVVLGAGELREAQ